MTDVVQVPETFETARAGLAPRVVGAAQDAIDYLELLNLGAEAGAPLLRPATTEVSLGLATWAEGVAAAIPVGDEVVLVGLDGAAIGVPWERLYAECGALLNPANTLPPRYLTSGFPTAAQIMALTSGT